MFHDKHGLLIPEKKTCGCRNLSIGAVAFVIIIFILRLTATATQDKATTSFRQKVSRFDFAGIVLIIGAVCCLVLALQWGGQTKPWSSAQLVDATQSGIRSIPLGLSQIVAVMVCSGLVSLFIWLLCQSMEPSAPRMVNYQHTDLSGAAHDHWPACGNYRDSLPRPLGRRHRDCVVGDLLGGHRNWNGDGLANAFYWSDPGAKVSKALTCLGSAPATVSH